MKKIISIALTFAMCVAAQAREVFSPQSALLPVPAKVIQLKDRSVEISRGIRITSSLKNETEIFRSIIKKHFGDVSENGRYAVEVNLSVDSVLPPEGYNLEIARNAVTVRGGSSAGVFYALMTLNQILLGDVPATAAGTIAAVRVEDAPRYARRALMLDPARHFLPVEDVKRYIDRMSEYKFNELQLHLTDDEGWKIEIKSHPELTEKGNADSDRQYYTQSELRDLVNYAARRHVTIVPELDVPGHTAALLAAYPELCCTGVDTAAIQIGKTHGLMLCASNEKVYTLYKDIITEVAQLFPGEYIHLGGDESVIDSNWGKCEADSILMSSKGYTSPAQLMNHFFGEILETVRSNGKKAVLWCELDRIYPPANEYLFDYPQDVTLVTWRNGLTPKCIELTAKHGNKLIMAPGEYAYLDYPQLKGDLPEWNNWGMPVTTLRKSYEFAPSYGLPDSDSSHIVGVMATLWGEAIADINRAMYMTYPRALAIAEAAWSAPERRNWNSFKKRMLPNIYDMMCSGISVRVPFEVMAE